MEGNTVCGEKCVQMPREKAEAGGGWRRRESSERARASRRETAVLRRRRWRLDGGSGGGGTRGFSGSGAVAGGGEGIRQDLGGDMAGSVVIGRDLSRGVRKRIFTPSQIFTQI